MGLLLCKQKYPEIIVRNLIKFDRSETKLETYIDECAENNKVPRRKKFKKEETPRVYEGSSNNGLSLRLQQSNASL